jgi:TP901-1 family phage major tail protein
MPAQMGRDMLLKCFNGTNAYVTIGGLRSRNLALNASSVDVTHAESAGRWRELLAGAGLRRLSLSGSGIFVDDAASALVRTLFFESAVRAWQIVIPHFGTIQAPFFIASLDYRAEHDSAMMFDMAMESAGEPSFTAL